MYKHVHINKKDDYKPYINKKVTVKRNTLHL
jgi:hypothetical protein